MVTTVGPHGGIDRAEAIGTGEELALLPDRIGVGLVQILFGRGKGTLGNKAPTELVPGDIEKIVPSQSLPYAP